MPPTSPASPVSLNKRKYSHEGAVRVLKKLYLPDGLNMNQIAGDSTVEIGSNPRFRFQ